MPKSFCIIALFSGAHYPISWRYGESDVKRCSFMGCTRPDKYSHKKGIVHNAWPKNQKNTKESENATTNIMLGIKGFEDM